MVAIAQLAEHRIVGPRVVGSNPTCHPKFLRKKYAIFGYSLKFKDYGSSTYGYTI